MLSRADEARVAAELSQVAAQEASATLSRDLASTESRLNVLTDANRTRDEDRQGAYIHQVGSGYVVVIDPLLKNAFTAQVQAETERDDLRRRLDSQTARLEEARARVCRLYGLSSSNNALIKTNICQNETLQIQIDSKTAECDS